jgi:hypothetical protein
MRARSTILLAITLATNPALAAETTSSSAASLQPGAISVFLGAMEVDDQSVRLEDPAFAGEAELDFSTLRGGGIVVEIPFGGSRLETGIEAGAGIDFEWQGGYRMGIGARWLGAELTFDDTPSARPTSRVCSTS